MFQPRARAGSKLTTVLDAEGKEIQAESRQDEEQSVKWSETIDLLLAPGYFRARIKGLSPFDKVVGGMTWCITTCNFDVDVDLLFQENSSIGQKISLTEKIVAVLPRMKCPHRIEPHQIQGMDFIHIYPVVQWLVKRAIETRDEMGDLNRQFSVYQFNKYHSLPEDRESEQMKEAAIPILNRVKAQFGPRRKYRRVGNANAEDEATRVQYTLLEFGRQHGFSQQPYSGGASDEKTKDISEQKTAEQIEQEEKKINSLMKTMVSADGKMSRPTASIVGSMVTLQSDEIKRASQQYAKKAAKLEMQAEKPGTIPYYRKVAANLRKQLDQVTGNQSALEAKYEEKKEKYMEVHSKLEQLETLDSQIEAELVKLQHLETGENKVVLEKLRSLVAENDSIKKKESEFKVKCKEELATLEADIAELEATGGGLDPEDEQRNHQIEKQHNDEKNKLQKIRLALARKNREISSLQRRIDEVPSRAELSQYQRRFVELYNQVGATHKETKQFYTLYNTLDLSKFYLEKEINLLNSIYDTFQQGMSNTTNKEQFLKQMEHIVEGVKQNRAKLERQREAEKMKRDALNDRYLDLIEKQRLYFKTVKDLREELRRNEMMTSKMAEMGL